MVVGEIAEPADLLIIGGGPGGYAAALRGAQLGRSVTLIEQGGRAALGGCCLHVGCIPSKTLIELANARSQIDALALAGLRCDGALVDLQAFQQHRREIVTRLASGVAQLLSASGVAVVEGVGRFSRSDRAAVLLPDGNVRFYEFRDLVIATGSRPIGLPHLPFDADRVLDSTGLLALEAVPPSLAVVGGGVIGLELGTAMSKLGCSVTIVETRDRLLPEMDAALSAPLAAALAERGVRVELGARAVEVTPEGVRIETPSGEDVVAAQRILVAVGRRPNTDGIGLEELGLKVDNRGLINVGPDLRASQHVAAIGDVVDGPPIAHKAAHQGQVAAEALSGVPAAFEPSCIPDVVFTDPEIATAGLTEADARAAGMTVRTATFPLSASGRAMSLGATRGFTRVVVDDATDRVVGTQIVGPHASELIAEGVLAIEMMASPEDLAGTIHPHPTLSEGLGEAALAYTARPLHIHSSSIGEAAHTKRVEHV